MKVIGECGKHAGYNMVNCPLCAIEEQQKLLKNKFHTVEYSGYWNIQEGAFYGDKNILDAEQVGVEQAEANAKRIVRLLNADESPIKEDGETTERCGICGGRMVLIRGKYPNTGKRSVCPTCTTERLEQIQEISNPNYGKVARENKIANGKTPNQ